MTRHYPKSNKVTDEYVYGTCSAMVGKEVLTINLPRTVSDAMSVEHRTKLDYKVSGNDLIISLKRQ